MRARGDTIARWIDNSKTKRTTRVNFQAGNRKIISKKIYRLIIEINEKFKSILYEFRENCYLISSISQNVEIQSNQIYVIYNI